MHHPEGESKINRLFQAQPGWRALAEVDSRVQLLAGGPSLSSCEHRGLQVDGQYAPGWSDELSQGDRKITQPRAEVCSHVSILSIGLEHPDRWMDQPAERVVKRPGKPPWADVFTHG